jgi:hypothetical protein
VVLACLAVVPSALSACSGPRRGVVEDHGAGDGRDGSRGRVRVSGTSLAILSSIVEEREDLSDFALPMVDVAGQ